MAQSTFGANATQFIDGVDTDFAIAGAWNLGVELLGDTKAAKRRSLGGFDLFGPAMAGRPLRASDTITAAELVLDVTSVSGPSGWGAKVERISRADWDYTTANWDRYRIGANWTAAGGDVATPPAAVAFSSPATMGEQIITGVLAFVTDAIASRGGIVLIRLKADNETPSQSQSCAHTAILTSSLRPRLRITYIAADPSPIDDSRPSSPSLRGERPEPAASPDAGDVPSSPENMERGEGLGRRLAVIPNAVRNLAWTSRLAHAAAASSSIPTGRFPSDGISGFMHGQPTNHKL